MDRLKQKFQSLEDAFNNFIRSIGGELISELMTESTNKSKNADYIFRKESIIVELKGFEKDHYHKNESDYNNFKNRLQKSLEKGHITESEVEKWFSNSKEPSENILNIIIASLKRTIENDIRNARKQIVESRKFFQISDAVGLIFFANIGNYFPPNLHVNIIKEFIMRKYSDDIDGFVYFTTSRVSESALVKGEGNIWLQYDWITDKEKQKHISDFVFNIGEKWTEFVCKNTGGKATYLDFGSNDEFDKQISSIKFIR